MGYLVEQYRNTEDVMKKLHKAKMSICEAMEALEEEMEYEEKRNYRGKMSRKHSEYSDRYDY